MIAPSYKLRRLEFFDSKVESNLDPRKRKLLSRFGALTRGDARRSIRPGGPPSPPSRPPKSRTGLLRRFIFFFVDSVRESVLIGPIRLGGKEEIGGTPQPGVLEHGGITRGRSATRYEARPFMRPAFGRSLRKLEMLLGEF